MTNIPIDEVFRVQVSSMLIAGMGTAFLAQFAPTSSNNTKTQKEEAQSEAKAREQTSTAGNTAGENAGQVQRTEDTLDEGMKNPLANIEYTDKVKIQAAKGDYHGFPESVDGFGADGKVTQIIGGDGVIRTKVEILGSYDGKTGVFQYIIEPDGVTCNHRLFVPNE